MKKGWNADGIGPQSGRIAIVTGANAGLGFETARVLASKGVHVVLACRSEKRGESAIERIRKQFSDASVELVPLDLSSLASVNRFVSSVKEKFQSLDLLVNNAGVMIPPASLTENGFELQIGVNFLGHFSLTAQLFPLLKKDSASRIVTLSSLAHRWGKIDFDTFTNVQHYKAWREYGQSKIACLMFALELAERMEAASIPIRSLSAHPGGTKTDLQRHSFMARFLDFMYMKPEQGTLPSLYCALDPDAVNGTFVGPSGMFELNGYPWPAKIANLAKDKAIRQELWQKAEELTGQAFSV